MKNLTKLDRWIKAAESGADARALESLISDMNAEPSWCERCKCHHYGSATCSDPWPARLTPRRTVTLIGNEMETREVQP